MTRGAYTAFRLAMDHPLAVSALVVLDAVPIIEALGRCDERFARQWSKPNHDVGKPFSGGTPASIAIHGVPSA